ncbi:NADPH-dependent diflavin oxidoreductase 1 [Durusdinium trenchii]|uniref:NADPH-dependent diflavin oxidoreductase 1 n=2 Tax=Durusdinium trenchii TaxID=1381693 RepID=A0ABP0HUN4_9DINO
MFAISNLRPPTKPDCLEDVDESVPEDPFDVDRMSCKRPSLLARAKRKRAVVKQMRQEHLQNFLNEFQFKNAFTPRSDSSIFGRKKYYPVHVAARLGDCEVLRDLLLLGVDAQQTDASGLLPLDIARAASHGRSHQQVIELLQEEVKVVSMREFHQLVNTRTKEL